MNDNKHDGRSVSLGTFLREARETAGLSKLQVEAMSGVGRMTIQRLESNYYSEPSPDDLARLARALELNDTDLFLLAGLPVPQQTASLDVMLRAEYGLPPEAIDEAKRNIAAIVARYDQKHTGNID
ncbi:MAG TPA: helix-turn-helix transcriptional regulator [Pseudonocardiaceae bacterium]|jgi:transcriptional regulator with XRE-family HTH domain|nr:helix-turn-helix transcriptional regulator [Pseudonocardiaceae bacterium]